MAAMESTLAAKAALRAHMRAARAAVLQADRDTALAGHLWPLLARPEKPVVAGVWPLPGEPNLLDLLARLHGAGQPIVLPETPPRGQPLLFRRWQPGSPLVRGRFGTSVPDGETAVPDIVLVPLLAFDGQGNRLGYGGGYYDRTLAAHGSAAAIGFAYALQRVAAVPVEPHDRRLDAIVTEEGIMRTGA